VNNGIIIVVPTFYHERWVTDCKCNPLIAS